MKKSAKNSSKDRSFFDDLKIFETIFLSKPEFSDLRVNIFVDPKHHRYPGYRWFAGRNSFVIEKLGGTVKYKEKEPIFIFGMGLGLGQNERVPGSYD